MAWQVEWLILWKMIVKMLTHIHMVVYTWWGWHIYKGDEVGVDVDCRRNMVGSPPRGVLVVVDCR